MTETHATENDASRFIRLDIPFSAIKGLLREPCHAPNCPANGADPEASGNCTCHYGLFHPANLDALRTLYRHAVSALARSQEIPGAIGSAVERGRSRLAPLTDRKQP